jgi:hypothetical protein
MTSPKASESSNELCGTPNFRALYLVNSFPRRKRRYIIVAPATPPNSVLIHPCRIIPAQPRMMTPAIFNGKRMRWCSKSINPTIKRYESTRRLSRNSKNED